MELRQVEGPGHQHVVGYESLSGTVSNESWSAAAVSKGLYMIRQANADAKKDIGQKNLLGWMLNDEPDYHNTPYQTVVSNYQKLKAVDSKIPVMVNFSGSSALWHYGNYGEADYKNYMKGGLGQQRFVPDELAQPPQRLDAPGKAVETLSNWSAGKRQFAVIEASDQQLPGKQNAYPGVTAASSGPRCSTRSSAGRRGSFTSRSGSGRVSTST